MIIEFYKNTKTGKIIKVRDTKPIGDEYVKVDSSDVRKLRSETVDPRVVQEFQKSLALADSIFVKLEVMLEANGFTQEEIEFIKKFKKRLI